MNNHIIDGLFSIIKPEITETINNNVDNSTIKFYSSVIIPKNDNNLPPIYIYIKYQTI